MKKFFILLAAVAVTTTASAQVLFSNDFEDGTLGKWVPWQNKTDQVKIVEGNKAKDSQYAMSFRTGVFVNVGGVKEGVKYKVSFDSNLVWGKHPGFAIINYYNKDTKKMEELTKVEIPIEKGFQRVEFTFVSKNTGGCRIVLAPDGTKGGAEFIVDNVKMEVAE